MSTVPSVSGGTTNVQGQSKDLRDVDVNQFLDLLIAELQNQDPLNPMDNADMLEQIGQIRQISSTNQLTDTLQAVLMGQNMATASSLIGKEVTALTDDGKNVHGAVERVSVQVRDENGSSTRLIRLHIGDQSVELKNVRDIVSKDE